MIPISDPISSRCQFKREKSHLQAYKQSIVEIKRTHGAREHLWHEKIQKAAAPHWQRE